MVTLLDRITSTDVNPLRNKDTAVDLFHYYWHFDASPTGGVFSQTFSGEYLKRQRNIQILDSLSTLCDNWNDNGASRFNSELILTCKKIVNHINEQPEIYPTARGSIQFEFYDGKNPLKYLEIEIFIDRIEAFKIDENGNENTFSIQFKMEKINSIINHFYA